MKEMIYSENMIDNRRKNLPPELLSKECYRGYEYIVLSLHSHPTAYVVLDKNDKWFGKFYDDINVSCHGGLTYSKNVLGRFLEYSEKYKCDVLSSVRGKWVIGWDYAHYGDYSSYMPEMGGKKWTTEEIVSEAKEVIDSLIDD